MRPFLLEGLSSSFPLPPLGGDEEVRTPDPLRARQVLSQLSYTPVFQGLGLPLHLFKLLKTLSESSKLNNKLLFHPADRRYEHLTVHFSLERR